MKTTQILAVFLLFVMCISLSACQREDPQSGAEQGYLFWTTSDTLKEYYLQKQDEWNSTNPQNRIHLTVETYSSSKIVNKLDSIMHGGALQVGEAIPDMVDLQWQALEQYLYPNRAYLFPTSALLEENRIPIDNEFLPYCRNGLCYALPYGGNQLVLYCNDTVLQAYDLDISAIQNVNDLWELAADYHQKSGNPFLKLDSNCAAALSLVLALSQHETTSIEEAYIDAKNTLNTLQYNGVLEVSYISSLDIEHICKSLQDKNCAAYIGPLSCAYSFIQKTPDLRGQLSIHALPVEQKPACHIPNAASVVMLSCENIRLMKDFLSFARLSPDAQLSLSSIGMAYDGSLNHTDEISAYYSNDLSGLYANADAAHFFENLTQYLPYIS